jgi:hypothetical protein
MRWLLNLAIAFLALGAVEAVVKPLARRFVQRRITSTSSGVCIAPSRPIRPRGARVRPLWSRPKPTPAVDGLP